jgi:hypothetical protein
MNVTIDNTPISKLTILNVTPIQGETTLIINWIPVEDLDLSHYNVYYSEDDFTNIEDADFINLSYYTTFYNWGLEPETEYYYGVTAVDLAGNELKEVDTVKGKVADITPPNITLTSPLQDDYANSTIFIDYESSEEISYCELSINDQFRIAYQETLTAFEGHNNLSLYCYDTSGNIGHDSVEFFVDSVPPSTVLNLRISEVPNTNTLFLEWDEVTGDDISRYKVYRHESSFDNVQGINEVGDSQTLSFVDSGLESEAGYYYGVTAVDFLGNENYDVISVRGFVPDFIPPNITIIYPEDKVYHTSYVQAEYTVDDNSGYCWFVLNGDQMDVTSQLSVPEGKNDLVVYCTDSYNNTGESSVGFDVDAEIPGKVDYLIVSSIHGQTSLNLTWNGSIPRDFKEFVVYRSETDFDNVNNMTPLLETVALQHIDTGLENNKVYYYAVTIRDLYGNEDKNVQTQGGSPLDLIHFVIF